jgi:desulfoferrodoxin (superoxide reductase-like protein)
VALHVTCTAAQMQSNIDVPISAGQVPHREVLLLLLLSELLQKCGIAHMQSNADVSVSAGQVPHREVQEVAFTWCEHLG